VPESVTVAGVDEALLGMLKTPDRTPSAFGVKTMLAVQLAPGAYETPAAQVPTPPNPKSPVMLKALKIRFAFPVLVMVTV
jgi:hypothetical protein